jgi:hypothetical protein
MIGLVQVGDPGRRDNPPPTFWLYVLSFGAWAVMFWLLWPR